MLEGVDARVHYIEYTPEMEEARDRGELKRNAFVRLRRVFIDEDTRLEIEDVGNADSLLRKRAHFENEARELLRNGVLPKEQGWGGWLGQYQHALKRAAMEIEYPPPQQQKPRERSLGR
jgi:hypothetical protein